MKKDAATLSKALDLFSDAVDTLRQVTWFPADKLQRLDDFINQHRAYFTQLEAMKTRLASLSKKDEAYADLKAALKEENSYLPSFRTQLNSRITYTEMELSGPPAGHQNPAYIAYHDKVVLIYQLPK